MLVERNSNIRQRGKAGGLFEKGCPAQRNRGGRATYKGTRGTGAVRGTPPRRKGYCGTCGCCPIAGWPFASQGTISGPSGVLLFGVDGPKVVSVRASLNPRIRSPHAVGRGGGHPEPTLGQEDPYHPRTWTVVGASSLTWRANRTPRHLVFFYQRVVQI